MVDILQLYSLYLEFIYHHEFIMISIFKGYTMDIFVNTFFSPISLFTTKIVHDVVKQKIENILRSIHCCKVQKYNQWFPVY